jgi:DNA-binding protein HU-beta
MIKADIVRQICENTGVDRIDAEAIVNQLLATIRRSVISNEPVYLRGFGTFKAIHRKAKTGRDIRRSKTVRIPAHGTPWFKPCIDLQTKVKTKVPLKNP